VLTSDVMHWDYIDIASVDMIMLRIFSMTSAASAFSDRIAGRFWYTYSSSFPTRRNSVSFVISVFLLASKHCILVRHDIMT
jgi:hypothetical protein